MLPAFVRYSLVPFNRNVHGAGKDENVIFQFHSPLSLLLHHSSEEALHPMGALLKENMPQWRMNVVSFWLLRSIHLHLVIPCSTTRCSEKFLNLDLFGPLDLGMKEKAKKATVHT